MVETDPLEKWRPSHAKSRALWIGSPENASDPLRIPCGSHLDPPVCEPLGLPLLGVSCSTLRALLPQHAPKSNTRRDGPRTHSSK